MDKPFNIKSIRNTINCGAARSKEEAREMDKSFPLNQCHPRKPHTLINRLNAFFHGIGLAAILHYRITTITAQRTTPTACHLLLLIAELTLSFIWVLVQPVKWRPVYRTANPERLPGDDGLPPIDVFICTADPNKEPSLDVMNTVISALALDYPPEKLHVYLSDDGGSFATFLAVKEAWKFAKLWIPFCRKYMVECRCPMVYFSRGEEEEGDDVDNCGGSAYSEDKKNIQNAYERFKDTVAKILRDKRSDVSRDHPSIIIEVISDVYDNEEMPLIVYVAREKKPRHSHHFKAGALNVLLRVSSMISNSPYILVLDCDMYCNNVASARLAMCFLLDSKLAPNLAFVQFPQRFYNLNALNDIYDGQLRYAWEMWEGFDGLRGPILSGTGFYIKREALYGTRKIQIDVDLILLKKIFGSSDEFIRTLYMNYKPNDEIFAERNALHKELQLLASCSYDSNTKWGEEVGFRYFSLVEDLFTGLNLHCEGWTSVYYEPSNPCFLGASPISLGEVVVQHTRWNVGISQISLSKFSPLTYGPLRMPVSQTMGYATLAYYPFYFLPLYILSLVPQLCLLRRIPLYPEVSSPYFHVFMLVFLSAQLKHIQEILIMGNSIRTWPIEQRMWMMKSLTCYLYATLDAIREKLGLTNASFLPTNKVVDDEVTKRYHMGFYDFQAPPLFMVPLCTLYIINLASLVIGFGRLFTGGVMVIQALIPLFGIVLNYPLLEGMVLRKDKGRVSPYVTLASIVISSIIFSFVSLANN